MHEDIKTYTLEGEIDDVNLVATKDHLVFFVESKMRDGGSVPVLDIEPQFTLSYIPDREIYSFILTLYGVYVGKEDAWQVAGLMNGKPLMKHIQNPK